MFLKAVPRRNGQGTMVLSPCVPFELLLMETRYGCVFFLYISLVFSGPCAARRSIYALGACEVCDER